jgi:hypothetical protein
MIAEENEKRTQANKRRTETNTKFRQDQLEGIK